MKILIVVVALVSTAGLWAWALLAPGEQRAALPESYRGIFSFESFQRPRGVTMADPFEVGQEQYFLFREDGSFLYRVLVSGGFEMTRNEGTIQVDSGGNLVLEQLSENRTRIDKPPQVYRPRWTKDDQGDLLVLTGVPDGFRLRLRPVKSETGPTTDGRPVKKNKPR